MRMHGSSVVPAHPLESSNIWASDDPGRASDSAPTKHAIKSSFGVKFVVCLRECGTSSRKSGVGFASDAGRLYQKRVPRSTLHALSMNQKV